MAQIYYLPAKTSKTGRFALGEDGSRGTFRSRAKNLDKKKPALQ